MGVVCFDEVVIPNDEPLLHKGGIDPPHIAVGWRELEWLAGLLPFRFGLPEWLALLTGSELLVICKIEVGLFSTSFL